MKRITILLADDHMMIREGVRQLLEQEADLQVVGEAENGRQAVEMAQKLRPDVVLMDLSMPLLNGLEATKQIRQIMPRTKVLALSAHSEHAFVEKMAELGASGYLLKQGSSLLVVEAIHEVQKGGTFFCPSAAKRHFNDRAKDLFDRNGKVKKKSMELTFRQKEVLQLISEGHPHKNIAVALGVTFKTVDKHRQALMARLDIHNTAELTRYAVSAGMTEANAQMVNA